MVGEHKPVAVLRQPDQREAKQGRSREIEAFGPILCQEAPQVLLAPGFIQQRQIDAAPGQHRPRA